MEVQKVYNDRVIMDIASLHAASHYKNARER